MAPATSNPINLHPAPPGGQRVVLAGVSWDTYRQLEALLAPHPGVRLSYDRGTLEILTKSPEHERFNHLLGRLLEAISDELEIDIAGFGGFTFFVPQVRGLEPDECYYIAAAPQVAGRDRIDLGSDPPPDLVIEVDLSSSSPGRMSTYAALGVGEVWLYDGASLTFHVLEAGGYAPRPASGSFPWLGSADLMRFLELRGSANEREVVRRFRAWVRQAGGDS